jgi:hypothetical protein
MYIPNCPEDSVLKRHFNTAVNLNRTSWLLSPPSDSMLRRHAGIGENGYVRASNRAATVRSHVPHSPPASSRRGREKRGFFARLMDLISGKA